MANPRLLALNNEPAMIRAVAREHGDVSMTVTPQIGADRTVMLSLSPVLSRSAGARRRRQELVIQADTLAASPTARRWCSPAFRPAEERGDVRPARTLAAAKR